MNLSELQAELRHFAGKNALDFHLSYYVGLIASQNRESTIVVVANDKGYEPMLEHAKAMGFAVRQQGHGHATPGTSAKAAPAAKVSATTKPAAKQAAAKKAPLKKTAATAPSAKKAPARKVTPAAKVVAKSANASAAKKCAVAGPISGAAGPVPPPASSPPVSTSAVSVDVLRKITDNLRKIGDKRPVKPASLRRALKSFLGAETADDSIEVALGKLIAAGIVVLGARSDVSYPGFVSQVGAGAANA